MLTRLSGSCPETGRWVRSDLLHEVHTFVSRRPRRRQCGKGNLDLPLGFVPRGIFISPSVRGSAR